LTDSAFFSIELGVGYEQVANTRIYESALSPVVSGANQCLKSGTRAAEGVLYAAAFEVEIDFGRVDSPESGIGLNAWGTEEIELAQSIKGNTGRGIVAVPGG
jgi:hypothetical protein